MGLQRPMGLSAMLWASVLLLSTSVQGASNPECDEICTLQTKTTENEQLIAQLFDIVHNQTIVIDQLRYELSVLNEVVGVNSQDEASSQWWIGVLLDAIATLAGTVGKQLLRYAAATANPWYYPLGLVFTAVIDPAFDLAAYSFTAQSIIAAMAGLVVVWNVLLAPWTLGEALTLSRGLGALLICIGTAVIGVYGSHVEVERTPADYVELFLRPEALRYYISYITWAVLSTGWWCCSPGSPVGAFFLCAFGGSLAGNSFTTKAAVELFACGELDPGCPGSPFSDPTFFVLAGCSLTTAVLSLYLLAVSLRGHEALYMITVYQGFFVLSGAISGNVVMDEKAQQSWYDLARYGAGVGTVLVGLWVLCRGEVDELKRRQFDGTVMA